MPNERDYTTPYQPQIADYDAYGDMMAQVENPTNDWYMDAMRRGYGDPNQRIAEAPKPMPLYAPRPEPMYQPEVTPADSGASPYAGMPQANYDYGRPYSDEALNQMRQQGVDPMDVVAGTRAFGDPRDRISEVPWEQQDPRTRPEPSQEQIEQFRKEEAIRHGEIPPQGAQLIEGEPVPAGLFTSGKDAKKSAGDLWDSIKQTAEDVYDEITGANQIEPTVVMEGPTPDAKGGGTTQVIAPPPQAKVTPPPNVVVPPPTTGAGDVSSTPSVPGGATGNMLTTTRDVSTQVTNPYMQPVSYVQENQRMIPPVLDEAQRSQLKDIDNIVKRERERMFRLMPHVDKYIADKVLPNQQEQLKLIEESERVYSEMQDPENFKGYWENKGTGSKVMAALGIFLGTLGSGLLGKQTKTLDILQQAVDNDFKQKEARFNKNKQILSSNRLSLQARQKMEAKQMSLIKSLGFGEGYALISAMGDKIAQTTKRQDVLEKVEDLKSSLKQKHRDSWNKILSKFYNDKTTKVYADTQQMPRQTHTQTTTVKPEVLRGSSGRAGGAGKAKWPGQSEFASAGHAATMRGSENVFTSLREEGFDRTVKAGSFMAYMAKDTNFPGLATLLPQQFLRQAQAERAFVNAVLRVESGAAIGQTEFTNAERQYFPRAGDGPKLVEQKRQNRLRKYRYMNLQGSRATRLMTPEEQAEIKKKEERMFRGSKTSSQMTDEEKTDDMIEMQREIDAIRKKNKARKKEQLRKKRDSKKGVK